VNGGEPSKKDDKSMQETVEKLKEEKLKIKEKRKEEKEKLSKFMKEWNKKKEDLELEDLKVSTTFYFKNLQLTKLVYLSLLFELRRHLTTRVVFVLHRRHNKLLFTSFNS